LITAHFMPEAITIIRQGALTAAEGMRLGMSETARSNDRSEQTEQGEPIKSARVAAGEIFHAPTYQGPKKPPDCDRVDPGDAGSGRPAEKHR